MMGVFAIEMDQDDPEKCTAKKMVRMGLAKGVSRKFHASDTTLVLNPFAHRMLSPPDKGSKGVLVVDCSWNLAQETFFRKVGGKHRRVPLLLPANPVNYAKPGMLSSVEAVAATLYILDEVEEAREMLNIYKWGPNFETLNHDPLESYRACKSEGKVLKEEREYFPHMFEPETVNS